VADETTTVEPFACLLDTGTDDEAYAALPECQACDGTGKDLHESPFDEPLAIHFAGPPVEIPGRRRQLCMWCGHVLRDGPRVGSNAVPPWPTGALLRIEDGVGTVVPHEIGDELPAGCCARTDPEGSALFAIAPPDDEVSHA